MKIPTFSAQTEWVIPTEFPDLRQVDEIAIDLETRDPDLIKKGSGAIIGNGEVIGIAVATAHYKGYFPIAHEGGGNMDRKKVLEWFKDILNTTSTKIFHNAMYDVCWIRSVTGIMMKGRIVDTMIAASVIDENRFKYSLDSLSKDYLDEGKYKYDLQQKTLEWSGGTVKDPMTNMHKLPESIVKEYAKQDVNLTLKLWNLFNKKLDKTLYTKTENNKVYTCRNIFELETRLFPCLVDMKFKGVRIDIQKLERLGKRLTLRRDNLLKIIKKHTQLDLQLWAATSIKQLLDNRKIASTFLSTRSSRAGLRTSFIIFVLRCEPIRFHIFSLP